MRILKTAKAIALLCPFILSQANAECISDLYSAGLSFDSYHYKVRSKRGEDSGDIISSAGGGVKLGKIIYCPEKRREYFPYYRLRYFNLSDAKKEEGFENLDEDILLHSFGLDTRFILDEKKEALLDMEARDEYRPTKVSPDSFILDDDKYFNLKILAGLRYFIYSNKLEDYTASIKAGGVFPLGNSSADPGALGEANLEYFKRINKAYSIRADFYYSRYEQDVDDTIVSRQELGFRYNYIFRY